MLFDSAGEAWKAVLLIWSVGALVSTLELLAARADYAPGGVFSWELARLRLSPRAGRRPRRVLDALFARGLTGLLVARLTLVALLVALLTLAPAGGLLRDACLTGLVATTLLLSWRREWGNDGSDHMSSVVIVTAFVAYGPLSDRFLEVTGLAYLCVQVCLAYGTAGAAKVVSPVWRSGAALALILDTATYGHARTAAALQRHVQIGQLMTRSVVAAEVALGLGLVLLLPAPWAWILLAWGASFHVGAALMMGLNTFLPSFLATYPALVYVHGLVWS
jgi:hypothetical protein